MNTVEVSRVTDVELRPFITQNNDVDYDRLTPQKGNDFLIINLELAHLGSTRKEIVADALTLSDGKGHTYPAIGIRRHKYIEGYDLYYLEIVEEFPGISVGPDFCTTSVVFEVPQKQKLFRLKINGSFATQIEAL